MIRQIRAAIYLRKSTKQQAASIPAQRKDCIAYAKRHGWKIAGEFADEGITGLDSTAKRPGFRSLIKAAERGDFEIALAWDLSRITRSDPMMMMAELLPLREAGVQIATTDKSEPREWDFTTFLTDGIESQGNNQELSKKSRGICRGQREVAIRGGWVAGNPPLGFGLRSEPCPELKKGVIRYLTPSDDAEAVAAAAWMFDAYANHGLSMMDLRDELERRGFKYTKEAVRAMLKSPYYVGDFVWNRTSEASLWAIRADSNGELQITENFKPGENDQRDWVYIRDNHPAIVDRGTFNRVQLAFARRKNATTPRRGDRGFALTGLCRCADCGRTMFAQVDKKTKGQPIVWKCSGPQSGNGCHPHNVYQRDLLASVAASVKSWFSDPKMIEAVKAEAERQLAERAKTVDVKSITKQRKSAMTKLAKAEDRLLMVSQDMIPRIEAQIRELEERIEEYDEALAATSTHVSEALRAYDVTAQDVLEKLGKIDRLIANADSRAVRDYLSEMIETISVEVTRKEVNGRYRYTFAGGEIKMRDASNLAGVCLNTCQLIIPLVPLKLAA